MPKGSNQTADPILGWKTVRGKNVARIELYPIGTDMAKNMIYGRLTQEEPGPVTDLKTWPSWSNGPPFSRWKPDKDRQVEDLVLQDLNRDLEKGLKKSICLVFFINKCFYQTGFTGLP